MDGGVAPDTAPACREAGANVLVAGSAIYGTDDRAAAIAGDPGGVDMGWNFRKKKNIPGGLWLKCPDCGTMLQRKKMDENLWASVPTAITTSASPRGSASTTCWTRTASKSAGEDLKTKDPY